MAAYGVGILGAGWVAGEYVRVFRDHRLTEIAGVYHRTPGKAARLLAEHGVDAREYRSEEELFEDEGVRIVVSCTPPDSRPRHIVRAAETGRHVVIEKPVALTMAGVEEARRAVERAGVRTVTSYEFEPNVAAALRFENGAVGKLSAVLDADTPYVLNVRLFGTEGTLRNNRLYSSRRYPGGLGYAELPTVRPDSADVAHHPFAQEIAHFLQCLEEGRESHASIHDTARSMAVVFAVEESLARGGAPVRVADVLEAARSPASTGA